MHESDEIGVLARGALTVADVAALFTTLRQEAENTQALAERRAPFAMRPVAERTVRTYVYRSKPPPKGATDADRRHPDAPIPQPIRLRDQIIVWVPGDDETLDDVRRRLAEWWESSGIQRRRRAPVGLPRKKQTR